MRRLFLDPAEVGGCCACLRKCFHRHLNETALILLREHLISSHFVSKRNAFRNGGRGVAPFSNRKMTVRTFSGTVQSTSVLDPCSK